MYILVLSCLVIKELMEPSVFSIDVLLRMSQTACLSCCALLYTKTGDETGESHNYLTKKISLF
jgi:hypothetical protein